ncbi:hypothetical protein [Streptomyces nitrosporeus]|uniref:hypothetical protein n=1 Tax=Streptomyces nitrosporeus TaxID=28894 RepID=UPI00167E7BD1|nr:hypothetical protein [Streptomyces nitrosporeus]GGZ28097.1 hypothetical protein GCM10010327_68210 [Streptomyces nitrosporeus]
MVTPQDTGVYISPAQMYQEVRSLAQAVGRIEAKLDGVLDETKDIRLDQADHEARLRALERARWPLPTIGVLAGVAGTATGLLALLR